MQITSLVVFIVSFFTSLTMSSLSIRRLIKVVTPRKQREGGGFIVRRPLTELGGVFLLVDHLDYDIPPGVGFPGVMHPHRGFETVAYQLQGTLVHTCMSGVEGVLTSGDVQWMTAGRGVVHGGGSSDEFKKTGGPVEAFQIWVNLPKKFKMVMPHYQDVRGEDVPIVDIPESRIGSTIKVISGTYNGTSGSCTTLHKVSFFDVRIQPGDSFQYETPVEHVAFAYVYRGTASFGPDRATMNAGQGSPLSEGHLISVSVDSNVSIVSVPAPHRAGDEYSSVGVAFILLIAEPIHEPVVRSGPFVMNTEAEIQQCYEDFQNGVMAAESRGPREEL